MKKQLAELQAELEKTKKQLKAEQKSSAKSEFEQRRRLTSAKASCGLNQDGSTQNRQAKSAAEFFRRKNTEENQLYYLTLEVTRTKNEIKEFRARSA